MSADDRTADAVAEALFSARAALSSGGYVLDRDGNYTSEDRERASSRCYEQAQAEALIACAEALEGIRRVLERGALTVNAYTLQP